LPDDLRAALAELKDRDGIPESEAIRRGTVAFLEARGITVGPKTKKGAKRPAKK
jgi:hypothetical protein